MFLSLAVQQSPKIPCQTKTLPRVIHGLKEISNPLQSQVVLKCQFKKKTPFALSIATSQWWLACSPCHAAWHTTASSAHRPGKTQAELLLRSAVEKGGVPGIFGLSSNLQKLCTIYQVGHATSRAATKNPNAKEQRNIPMGEGEAPALRPPL